MAARGNGTDALDRRRVPFESILVPSGIRDSLNEMRREGQALVDAYDWENDIEFVRWAGDPRGLVLVDYPE